MKKLALITLVFSVLFSSFSVTYAVDQNTLTSTTLSKEMFAMNNLGLMQNSKGSTNLNFSLESPTKLQVKNILVQLNPTNNESITALFKDLSTNEPANEKEVYSIILELLGYKKNVDFLDKEVFSFAKSIGLNPSQKVTLNNDDLAKALNDCLRSKTKEGREYFEVLLENGFLSDYNKNKKVPETLVFDGKTQPIFNHDEAIYEKVYVESPQDTDLDQKRDLIEVWIKRPIETEKGMKVPAVFEVSPYVMGTNDDLYIMHNVDEDLKVGPQSNPALADITYVPETKTIPEARKILGKAPNGKVEPFEFGDWYNFFFARGYAVVFSGGIGTRGSEGITSCGSVDETISTVAVIDWLNGRTKAFTNKTDNIEVSANWCTGNVGMSGRSYRGTLPIATAATGVEGLKTIVPVAAISNWYDYYKANGLNVAGETWQGDDCDLLATYCMSRMFDEDDYTKVKSLFEESMKQMRIDQDRVTGDYNKFWDERNYLNNADKMKASVFIVHGLSDWNVKSKQFDGLWKKLEEYNVPRKIVLHQGEHISIGNLAGIDFNDMMNRWFDYWLYDIDNNVMEEIPTATIQNNNNLEWETFNSWPVKSETAKVYLNATDDANTLSLTPVMTDSKQTFKDDLSLSGYDRKNPDGVKWLDTLIKTPEIKREDRLAFTSTPLSKDTMISGTINVSIEASLNQPTGIISAMLVDYGTEYRPTIETEVVVPNGIIFGGNAGKDDIVNFVMESTPSSYKVISRGWMDAQNRLESYRVDPLTPGETYTFNLDMQPMNYTVKAGHKIGLILYSTDGQFTMRPLKTTNFTVDTSKSFVEIPVVNEIKK